MLVRRKSDKIREYFLQPNCMAEAFLPLSALNPDPPSKRKAVSEHLAHHATAHLRTLLGLTHTRKIMENHKKGKYDRMFCALIAD